ncbi:MAG: DUF4935 domain-containing protein [Sphingobacteriaceae bacterium]|nr:MAG: DUF4935 domain-containing protein [Sphingobacteriaceae bacterium]
MCMLIVLDTNIVVENWTFDKPYHRAFIDYVNSVNCEVVFPQIVWSEMRALYKSHLMDAINKQASANRQVSKFHFTEDEAEKEETYIDFEVAYETYAHKLLEKLRCNENSIIDYPTGILPLLAEKAIARMKPFGATGEEFRDAILWHSVLQIAQEYESLNPVVFISKNTREFSDASDKSKLHSELNYELNQLENSVVLYYPSLEEFIKAHKTPLEHVKFEWILKNLPMKELEEIFLDFLDKKRENLMPYFERKYSYDYIFDSDWQRIQFKLREPGLNISYAEEAIYTYKNGENSLFIDFETGIYFGTSYYPRHSDLPAIRNLNEVNYAAGFIELDMDFTAQVEFNITDKALEFRGIVYYTINYFGENYPTRRKRSPLPTTIDGDYDELPF